eukprot:8489868-Prorocentrum_lima.AAC.1
MQIDERWCVPPPHGLGRVPTMRRAIGIGQFTFRERKRTRLLLRAWMLWRAGPLLLGWTAATPGDAF